MIYWLDQFVAGPFQTETPYQKACVAQLRRIYPGDTFVDLETEETEPGMPDTVRLSPVRPSLQIEFKVSDARGAIKFKKSQPLWYKRHLTLDVIIIAWDKRMNRSVLITSDIIVLNADLRFQIPMDLMCQPFEMFMWKNTRA
jgi:hypothetical protein